MATTKNSFIKNAKERDFYLDINYLNLKKIKQKKNLPFGRLNFS